MITVSVRIKNMREVLLLAGISEINAQGVTGFSIRRVAAACGVSCAAPYKHFKDKKEFINAIIEYVNGEWRQRQEEILSQCGGDLRRQLVEVACGYIHFLMEKPYYRSILLLKDDEFDNIYHRPRGALSSRSQQMEQEIQKEYSWSPEVFKRKLHIVRGLLFGTMFMLDTGELPYCEDTMAQFRYAIDREFDLP